MTTQASNSTEQPGFAELSPADMAVQAIAAGPQCNAGIRSRNSEPMCCGYALDENPDTTRYRVPLGQAVGSVLTGGLKKERRYSIIAIGRQEFVRAGDSLAVRIAGADMKFTSRDSGVATVEMYITGIYFDCYANTWVAARVEASIDDVGTYEPTTQVQENVVLNPAAICGMTSVVNGVKTADVYGNARLASPPLHAQMACYVAAVPPFCVDQPQQPAAAGVRDVYLPGRQGTGPVQLALSRGAVYNFTSQVSWWVNTSPFPPNNTVPFYMHQLYADPGNYVMRTNVNAGLEDDGTAVFVQEQPEFEMLINVQNLRYNCLKEKWVAGFARHYLHSAPSGHPDGQFREFDKLATEVPIASCRRGGPTLLSFDKFGNVTMSPTTTSNIARLDWTGDTNACR